MTVETSWLLDTTDGYLQPGDVVTVPFRGDPYGRFEVVRHDGRGMVYITDPFGKTRPMRPNTLLRCAVRIERDGATIPVPDIPHDVLGGW
jgi:hypothetical protein